MLILSRKAGEKIIINGDIEVTVTEIKGGEVRIGIKAPKNISVYREEVYTRIQEENKNAIVAKSPDLSGIKPDEKKS
jgi:carbon storage regulator